MKLDEKREELVQSLRQVTQQLQEAAINVQRIEGAIALIDTLLKEEAEGTNEDVPASD